MQYNSQIDAARFFTIFIYHLVYITSLFTQFKLIGLFMSWMDRVLFSRINIQPLNKASPPLYSLLKRQKKSLLSLNRPVCIIQVSRVFPFV